MAAGFSKLSLHRVRPPIRRVLAVDAGSRRIKLALAESDFGRVRLLQQEMIDLQAEGLVSPTEIAAHLQATIEECGNPPLALVLPQHLSISQVLDLPVAPESEVDKMIADETVKLSGVSESRIVYDFVRAESSARGRQQFWVTLAQEGDIRERILKLGVEQDDLCEVTTTANALIAAYRAACPLSSRSILVHLGAQSTVLAVMLAGQGAFATTFQMGGDFFTRALARLCNCPEESAETTKRKTNLLHGPQAMPEFVAVVDGWVAELKRQLNEWFEHHPNLSKDLAAFELIAGGGGFDQPGLLEYLAGKGLRFQTWPAAGGSQTPSTERTTTPTAPASLPAKGFEVAFGTALQALGHSAQPVSLLPEDYRQAWRKRLNRQRIELASAALLVVCAILLGLATWQKLSIIRAQSALRDKIQAGSADVEANDALAGELLNEYQNIRPVFAAHQNTMDTLKTIALLQQSRTNRDFWYVLIADQQSYFSRPPLPPSTNAPVKTNIMGAPIDFPHSPLFGWRTPVSSLTNLISARPGYIVGLCVPGDAEAARRTVGELVNGLKHQPLFTKADLLSDDLRRNLADPKVTLPDRNFVLALDFAETEFQQPVPSRKTSSSRSATRHASRLPPGAGVTQSDL
jgi:Tfp pilus assembly PilM family ATPase